MSEALSVLNHRPINFYGKVIDQYQNPIGGVNVKGGVMVSKTWMGGKTEDHFTTTDTAGIFSFSGLEGRDISIWLEKPGYEYKNDPTKPGLFKYSLLSPENERYKPDPAAPVIFRMWKQQGAEPLISGDKFFRIKGDGTPFTIDLLNGKKIEGRTAEGDLVVSVRQPASLSRGERFDWSFEIEALDGGIVVMNEAEYLNEAPEDGYEIHVTQELKSADRAWSDVARKTFFVKSRNGSVFSRVTAEINANYQGGAAFAMKYLVNPKPGSRNWEYDPSQRIKLH